MVRRPESWVIAVTKETLWRSLRGSQICRWRGCPVKNCCPTKFIQSALTFRRFCNCRPGFCTSSARRCRKWPGPYAWRWRSAVPIGADRCTLCRRASNGRRSVKTTTGIVAVKKRGRVLLRVSLFEHENMAPEPTEIRLKQNH